MTAAETPAGTPRAGPGWPLLLALALLALLSVDLRLDAQRHHYGMVDELIPVAVIAHMRESGTPDTNWARTAVREDFRYHQYNFSSYHLAGLAATWRLPLHGERPFDATAVRDLRRLNAVFGGLAVLLAGLIGFRLQGNVAAAFAAVFAAVQVTLMQDALYARPEAFATLLAGLLFFAVTGAVGWRRVLVSGGLAGLLLACKISFVVLLPFALASLWLGAEPGRRVRTAVLFVFAAAAGFALGAPYAVLSPSEYLFGVDHLQRQYNGGHWPHGVVGGSLPERLAHSGRYLLETCGLPLLLLFVAGVVQCLRSGERRALAYLIGIGATAAWFLQSVVFFERNLSHAMPFAFALAGVGLAWLLSKLPGRPAVAAGLAALAIVLVAWPAALVSHRLLYDALPGRSAAVATTAEADLRASGHAVIDIGHNLYHAKALAQAFCGHWVQRLQDFGDTRTRQGLDELAAGGQMQVLRRVPGPFHGMQVSTLQTYHGGDAVFLAPSAQRQANCQLRLEPLPASVAAADTTGMSLAGTAVRDGHHPGALGLPAGAAAFATWAGNDAHQGRIAYEGRLCDDQVLPLISGPVADGVSLVVETADESGAWTSLYDAAPPRAAGRWVGLGVSVPGRHCFQARIVAEDRSDAWGTWIALGAPIAIESPLSGTQTP